MGRFQNAAKIGLRDKSTGQLVAVYPEKAEGTDSEIEDRVKFWFYQQDCTAEEELNGLAVDVLTPEEEASHR